jgi:uncharacterized protein YkwD
VLAILYAISGIGRRNLGRKIFAILLVVLLIGVAYQNPSYITNTAAFKDLLTSEATPLAPLASLITGSASVVTSTISTYPTQGSATTAGGTQTTSIGESSIVSHAVDPLILNGGANITYPSDYNALANYTLGLINTNRASDGLSPVTLSNIPSAQQHSDSMLYYGYFSHWDTQGYKPYMRYTLLGGTGSVAENIALDSCTSSPANATLLTVAPCSLKAIENGINNSEWGMMYNDVGCCNNGHRDNILDPLHDQVSIGIAYNSDTGALYFVEDFQNDYIALSTPIVNSGYQIEVAGSMTSAENVSQIGIYYDASPQAMNVSQLDQTSEYGPGTFVGGVLPPCAIGCEYYSGAVTVYASSWQVNSDSITVDFSLNDFIKADGTGVYTMYVQTGSSTADSILTYSIFVPS